MNELLLSRFVQELLRHSPVSPVVPLAVVGVTGQYDSHLLQNLPDFDHLKKYTSAAPPGSDGRLRGPCLSRSLVSPHLQTKSLEQGSNALIINSRNYRNGNNSNNLS